MLKYLINRFKQRPAESLVEVILALFVVSVGAGAATVLIVSSILANSFSKDNLVALNLAVEGVEAIRNIRDTNWVKFAYDKENCWYMKPEMDSTHSCDDANNKIADGAYTIDLDPENYRWGLNLIGPVATMGLDLSTISPNNRDYRMHFLDLDDTDGTFDSQDIYVSETTWNSALPPFTKGEESKFYRMVTVDMSTIDSMAVTSLVQWKDGSTPHQVQFSSILTNYNRF